MLVQVEWGSIDQISVRGQWMDVSSVQFCDLQIGSVRNMAAPVFWADLSLGAWIRVESPEGDYLYYPVTEITGFKTHGPLGG